VIFDMDGVLADSEPAHFAAMNAVLGRYGCSLNHEQHARQMGMGFEPSLRATIEDSGVPLAVEELAALYAPAVLEEIARSCEPLPGAVELVQRLRELGVSIALASSSLPSWIEATLAAIGLTAHFDAVVSGQSVANPKPAPDIYLRAAELLGLEPGRCIAVEDSPTGLRSIRAAGMLAVQVRSASSAFPPQAEADIVLGSLEAFDLSLLAS